MIKLNPQMTLDLLKLAVAERGENHIAETDGLSCMYSVETKHGIKPSCIVGHVLHYVGMPMANYRLRENRPAAVMLEDLRRDGEIEIDYVSIDLLRAAQSAQDGLYVRANADGHRVPQPWGYAVRYTLARAQTVYGLTVDYDLHTDLTVAQVRQIVTA